MMKSALLVLICSVAVATQQAATSFVLEGIVVSAESSEPVAGVQIFGPFGRPLPTAVNGIYPQAEYDAYLASRIRATTDASGRFRIEGPSSGRISLIFEKPQFLPRELQYTLKANEVGDIGQIRLYRSGTIRGRVVTSQGQPAPDYAVSAYRILRQGDRKEIVSTARTRTNDRGEFRLTDLRADDYLIHFDYRPTSASGALLESLVATTDDGRKAFFYPSAKDMSRAQLVGIDGNDVDLKDIVALPENTRGVVRLHLSKEPGAPDQVGIYIQNLTVSEGYTFGGGGTYYSGGARRRPPMVNLPGDLTRTYWMSLPGVYEVRWVDPTGYGTIYAAKRFEFTGDDLDVDFAIGNRPERHVEVIIRNDGPDDLQAAIARVTPRFCLRESTPCTLPVPQAMTPLGLPLTPNEWRVNLGPIPQGIYSLSLSGPESTGLPRDVYASSIVQGQRDVLVDGALVDDRTTPVVVQLRLGLGSLKGQVVDAQDKSVQDARVFLDEDPPAKSLSSLYNRKRAVTDQYGNFSFENIRPGNYRIYSGTEPADSAVRIHVAERANEVVRIHLKAK